MSFSSWLQRLFTFPSAGDPEDEEHESLEWNQNARIVLAIIVVFLSALVVYWILS